MKKIITLGLVFVLISAVASAQKEPGNNIRRHRVERDFRHDRINRPERFELRKNEFRYNMAQRNARRDGFVGPMERRRLYKMRRHDRREVYQFRHNGRNRVI